MKVSAITRFRQKLAHDEAVYGLWVTLESPSISEMAVALGLDWIVIDAEHGHLDWKEILEHLRATVRSDTVALVRIAQLDAGLIKRALDIGADGILVPWIETAEQLRQAISFAMYPPEGIRGIGAERATGWGQCLAQHAGEANEHVLVVPLIETVAAGKNIAELCQSREVDTFFFGPADYSSTAGHRGRWEGPGVAEQLLAIKDVVRKSGKHCGVLSTAPEDLAERRRQGFRVLGVGSDSGLLLRGLHSTLAFVGRDRRILATLTPEPQPSLAAKLPCPSESLRPDRPETVSAPGLNEPIEIAAGARLDLLVSARNGARNLMTGLVTFEPGARLPCHTHPVAEAITVISGSVIVSVEGRKYALAPFDTIVVPRGLPHASWSARDSAPAVVHSALAAGVLSRDLISAKFDHVTMPNDSTGLPGREHVTRHDLAPRTEIGSGAAIVDHFNHRLVPGVGISGGCMFLQPGGRWAAQVLEFDLSICVIQGAATCFVEGRRHPMVEWSTILLPRGRVHSLMNEDRSPMVMIWTCAGPALESIAVDESCVTPQGNPWKS